MIRKTILGLGTLWLLGACQVKQQFDYTPPPLLKATPSYSNIVDAPFEDVWRALISGVGGSFFGIDQFERDSGLLTLSFTAERMSDLVTGGHTRFIYDNSNQRSGQAFWAGRASSPKINIDFDGDYADFLQLYRSGTLAGKVNLVVQPLPDGRTEIVSNQRYVVTASIVNQVGASPRVMTWSWNSGAASTQTITNQDGEAQSRTLQATGAVEEKIAEAIELSLAQRI